MFCNLKNLILLTTFVVTSLLAVQHVQAEDEKIVDTKADNTKVNKRDKDGNELTADNQSQSKSDVDISAKIRQMIVKEDTLSTNAHNIKIITVNGMVTLKGPVKSDAEKTAVEQHAIHIVGEKNVKSEIEIAP